MTGGGASRRGPAILALIGIAVAVVLFFVLRDDEEPASTPAATTTEQRAGGGGADKPEKPAEPERTEIVVKGGQPVGGVAAIEVDKGGTIAFEVTSDSAQEVHLHGYDVAKEVEPGDSVTFEVPADIEGVFEAELEDSATPIAEITVNP